MFRMKKDGIIRLVVTEAEAQRYEGMGYKRDSVTPAAAPKNGEIDFTDWTVEQLRQLAEDTGIALGNATSHKTILKKVQEGMAKLTVSETDEEDDPPAGTEPPANENEAPAE